MDFYFSFWSALVKGSVKIHVVKQELMQRQIPWKTVVPPLWRLFWYYGLAVAPPMFIGFFGNFVISWLGFWGLSLLCAYILPWGHQDPMVWTVLSWGLAAALFGVLDGSRVQQEASRLGVPRWKDFR